jgi:hypothetical protein
MRIATSVLAAVLAAILLPACQSPGWKTDDALAADSLELVMDDLGMAADVEYHIPPEDVPAVVRQAMDRLHPGGPFTGAEKEYEGGLLYYELTREVDGMDIEAMFFPDGRLHSEEIEVPESTVPAVVREAAQNAIPGSTIRMYEEIRDSNRALYEYHVKSTRGGMNYKVMLGTTGQLLAIYREIEAEIEVRQP